MPTNSNTASNTSRLLFGFASNCNWLINLTKFGGNMLSLHKTKHSQFCLDLFKTNQGFNIIHNDYFLFKEMVKQSYDLALAQEAFNLFQQFKIFLKENKVKLIHFSFGFNHQHDKYSFQYVIRSKVHNNPDFQVDGFAYDLDIPFVFFPSMFSKFLIDVLNQVPIEEIKAVGRGE